VGVSGFAQLAEELGLPTTLSEVGVVDGEFRPQWQMLKQESHPPSTCLIDFSQLTFFCSQTTWTCWRPKQ